MEKINYFHKALERGLSSKLEGSLQPPVNKVNRKLQGHISQEYDKAPKLSLVHPLEVALPEVCFDLAAFPDMAPPKKAGATADKNTTTDLTKTNAGGVKKATKEGRGGGSTGRGSRGGRDRGRGGITGARVGTRHSERIPQPTKKYDGFIIDLHSQKNVADKKVIAKKFSKANLKIVPTNLAVEDLEQLSDREEDDDEVSDTVGVKVAKPKKLVDRKIVSKPPNPRAEEVDEDEFWDGNMDGTPYKRVFGSLRAEVRQNRDNVQILTEFCNKVVDRHEDLENRVYSNGLALGTTEKALRMHSVKLQEHDNCLKKANENFAGLPGMLRTVEENSKKEAAKKVKNAEKRIGARQVADMELLCVNLAKEEVMEEAQTFLKNKGEIEDVLDMNNRKHRRLLSKWLVSIKYEVRGWDENPLYSYEGGSWFMYSEEENSLSTYVIKLVSSGMRNELLNQSQDLGKDVFKVSHSWQDRAEYKRKDDIKNQKNEKNPGVEHIVRQNIPGFYEVVPKLRTLRTPPHIRRLRKKNEREEKKKSEAEEAARLAAAAQTGGAARGADARTDAMAQDQNVQVQGGASAAGVDLVLQSHMDQDPEESINMEPTSPKIVQTNQNSTNNSADLLGAARTALADNGSSPKPFGTKSQ